jgi:hypothetical protein
MPDITSELALSTPHLVTCIYASTNGRTVSCLAPTFRSGTFRRPQKLNANSWMHFPFHIAEKDPMSRNNDLDVDRGIKEKNGNVPRATVAFAVLPP